MAHLHLFSTWGVGFLNGCSGENHKLPNSLKYGTIALASGIHAVHAITKIPTTSIRLPGTAAGFFVGIPLMIGSIFCTGHMLGSTLRYTENEGSKVCEKQGGRHSRFTLP